MAKVRFPKSNISISLKGEMSVKGAGKDFDMCGLPQRKCVPLPSAMVLHVLYVL